MWQPAGHAASWLDAWVSPDIQGQQAFARGDYTTAAQHFTDPLRQGIAWYRAENYPAATVAFHQAEQTPEVLLWTGNSYAQQKQWQQALNSYDRALSLRPDWQLAQDNRAKIAAIIMQLRQKSATACRRRARSRTINRMRSNTISNPRKALSKKIFSRRPVATRR